MQPLLTFAEQMKKKKNSNSWNTPLLLFISAALVFFIIRFIAAPDKRYRIRGIDVSAHTGKIDWENLPNQRVYFAYVKASEGVSLHDRNFKRNVDGANRANIPVGAYHFFNFNRDGILQAKNFLAVARGAKLQLPPVVDFEEFGNNVRNPKRVIVSELKAFIAYVEKSTGSQVLIYTNEDCYKLYLDGCFPNNPLWISSFKYSPKVTKKWLFWQFTHEGKLHGVEGKVDFNVFRGSVLDWKQYLKTVSQ